MMVAEFVARGQSGSPINGEIPSLNSNMPGSQGREGLQNGADSFLGQDVVLGPISPGAPSGADGFSNSNSGYAANLKRKELFSQRKQREFIPDNKKDDSYWDRRRRNNEAAKRSREKRRFNDMVLEQRVVELTKENHVLKAQLDAIKEEYGICGENIVCVEKVMATLPSNEQVLSITKRPKLSSAGPSTLMYQSAQSPIPTSVIHQPVSHPVMSSPPPSVAHSVSSHHLHLHHPHPDNVHHETSGYHHQHQHPHSIPHLHHHEQDSYHRTPYPSYQHSPFPVQYEHVTNASVTSVTSNNNNNALNLSARSRTRSRSRSQSRSRSGSRAQSPYEVSSGSGSGDEGCMRVSVNVSAEASTITSAATIAPDLNNSLPLKLRHKSHLGDKDAASALLSLQNIKQEPGPRASPPWDGEGSSDERDSGISLGAEWPSGAVAVATAVMASALQKQSQMIAADDMNPENKHLLQSQIVRLTTEVANLKSLVIRNKGSVKSLPAQH